MDILRKYKQFINEAVDTNKEVKTLADVPTEVIKTAKEIAKSIYDEVRKPVFELCPEGILMKFGVSSQDFKFIEENEPLSLDVTKGAKEKRTYNVVLEYYDQITEMFEVQYIVKFEMNEFVDDVDDDDEDDESDDGEDVGYFNKRDPKGRFGDEFDFDEDEADMDIKKGRIKIEDVDITEGDDDDDE